MFGCEAEAEPAEELEGVQRWMVVGCMFGVERSSWNGLQPHRNGLQPNRNGLQPNSVSKALGKATIQALRFSGTHLTFKHFCLLRRLDARPMSLRLEDAVASAAAAFARAGKMPAGCAASGHS